MSLKKKIIFKDTSRSKSRGSGSKVKSKPKTSARSRSGSKVKSNKPKSLPKSSVRSRSGSKVKSNTKKTSKIKSSVKSSTKSSSKKDKYEVLEKLLNASKKKSLSKGYSVDNFEAYETESVGSNVFNIKGETDNEEEIKFNDIIETPKVGSKIFIDRQTSEKIKSDDEIDIFRQNFMKVFSKIMLA